MIAQSPSWGITQTAWHRRSQRDDGRSAGNADGSRSQPLDALVMMPHAPPNFHPRRTQSSLTREAAARSSPLTRPLAQLQQP